VVSNLKNSPPANPSIPKNLKKGSKTAPNIRKNNKKHPANLDFLDVFYKVKYEFFVC
jgi:hypothetical protein